MPLCLCLPLPCGLPTSVAVASFLCFGPFRVCSLLCPFLCLSFSRSAGVVSSPFLNLAVCAPIFDRYVVSLSCHFLLCAMLVLPTLCLARPLLPKLPSFCRGSCTGSTALCATFCALFVLASCGVVATVLSCRPVTCKSRRISVFPPCHFSVTRFQPWYSWLVVHFSAYLFETSCEV